MRKNCTSTIRALLSAAIVALIVMANFVQFHHHCECSHHSSPIHQHHCALHIDAADQLRYDIDFSADITPQIDAAIEAPSLDVIIQLSYSSTTYYNHPLLTHNSGWCDPLTRRGPPSDVDIIC